MTDEESDPPKPGISEVTWDARHQVKVENISDLRNFPLITSGALRVIVAPGRDERLSLDVLYEPEDSQTLLVVLHGALNRRKFELPRFEWRSSLQDLRASKLYLSDSSVSQRADMEIGWYIGRVDDDLTDRYVDLVRHIRDIGGYERVIFVGSSGGGFASLAMSRKVAGSGAVAFSPQSTIAGYYASHRRMLARVLSEGKLSFENLQQQLGSRTSIRQQYAEAEVENHFRYVQNSGDLFHFEAHYVPFALSQGVDPEIGGRTQSGRGLFVSEKYDNGHVPPPRLRFRHHIMEAHFEFYSSALVCE